MDFCHKVEGMECLFNILSTLVLSKFLDEYNVRCCSKGECCISNTSIYREKIYDANCAAPWSSNQGMYTTVLGRWRHCTHLHLSTRCKPYQHMEQSILQNPTLWQKDVLLVVFGFDCVHSCHVEMCFPSRSEECFPSGSSQNRNCHILFIEVKSF